MSGSEPGQLNAVAKLMEQLGFPKAADKVFAQYAETSADGASARAEFLGRQKRAQEALDLLESRWDDVPLERLLSTAVQVVRVQDDPKEWAPRIEPWLAKARRIDPGSVVIELLQAELLSLESRDDEAEKIYRDLLTRDGLDAMQKAIVSNNLAFHLARPESVAEAKKLIEDAIGELGPLPDLLDTRGMIRMAAGEKTEAVADFAEAVLQPTDVKFLHLAWGQLESGDQAAAKASLEAGRRRGLARSNGWRNSRPLWVCRRLTFRSRRARAHSTYVVRRLGGVACSRFTLAYVSPGASASGRAHLLPRVSGQPACRRHSAPCN